MIGRAFLRAATVAANAANAATVPVRTNTLPALAVQARTLSSKPHKASENEPTSSESQVSEPAPRSTVVPRNRHLGMMHSQVQQMFDDLEREFFGPNFPFSVSPWRSGGFGLSGERALGTMPMDVSETDKHYNISVEIPGANKEELHVNVEDGVLTVSTEKKEEHNQSSDKFHRMERSYGRLQRSLRLPENADSDKIDASYADGVLKIVIPKHETLQSRGKRVQIK